MEVISIEKKINHLIFYLPLMTNDKFLSLSLLTPLEKILELPLNERYGTRQSERQPSIWSNQLQKLWSDPNNSSKTCAIWFEQNPRWVLGLLILLFLFGCCVWLFEKKIVWLFLFVIFVFVVSIEIESERLDFNLIENEFDGLKFGIPKSSLSHSRC